LQNIDEVEQEEVVEENITKEIVEIKPEFEMKKNIPFTDLNINWNKLKEPIFISPSLPFLDNFEEYQSKIRKDNDYILSLKTQFNENPTIDTVIKIISYYKIMKRNHEVAKFSFKLNILNKDLKEPYLNLIQILKEKQEFDEVEKIKKGCFNCGF
jgi:hypothetical protein